jgi:hypothetical protein
MNELHGLIHKAVVGSGFPPGHADAIVRAGIWLARRRFPVCDIVARAIEPGMTDLSATECAGGCAFEQARATTSGLAAIELLLAKPAGFRVMLKDLDEPALLLGFSGVAAEAHEVAFKLSSSRPSFHADWPGGVDANEFTIPPAGEFVMTRAEKVQPDFAIRLASRYDPKAVADGGWNRLAELAAKTYVPATDQSRIKGAGAGLTDND